MTSEFKFIKEWPADTAIGWWNEGRAKLNEIIKRYNQWQIDGFSVEETSKLRATIIQGLQTFAERSDDGGSGWATELRGMLKFVNEHTER